MKTITSKFVLVRIEIRTNNKKVIFQSDDRKELHQLKSKLESQAPSELLNSCQYRISETQEVLLN